MTTALLPEITAALLALAALAAVWRSARRAGWREPSVWVQPLSAALFYLLLFPPALPLRGDKLTVLTPGASAVQLRRLPHGQEVLALPGVIAPAYTWHAPDLASALRQRPAVRGLDVIGDGLPLRDQAAADARGVQFQAASEHGVVELESPRSAVLGSAFDIGGRAAAPAASVELRDPSGAVIDSGAVDRGGAFRLSATARAPGPARFELRAYDSQHRPVDMASVPVPIEPGAALTMIERAGTPDPELKYFRRWAADAGLGLRVAAGLSEGVALRDGDTQLTADTLASLDLAVIDERAWAALGGADKAALGAAVDNGLGLLLRVSGPPDPVAAADWAAFGYGVTAVDAPRGVTLDHMLNLHRRDAFTLAPAAVTAGGATPLWTADDGTALAWWHPQGRGRVGLWTLTDSYRLVLLGDTARYASLWSQTIATLARARPAAPAPQLPERLWMDERAVLCGLDPGAEVADLDGRPAVLSVDRRGCAGYWPAAPGWHRLQMAGASWPLYVRADGDGEGLRAARNRAATLALVRPDPAGGAVAPRKAPLPRWPLFIAWLVLAAGVWWRERQQRRLARAGP